MDGKSTISPIPPGVSGSNVILLRRRLWICGFTLNFDPRGLNEYATVDVGPFLRMSEAREWGLSMKELVERRRSHYRRYVSQVKMSAYSYPSWGKLFRDGFFMPHENKKAVQLAPQFVRHAARSAIRRTQLRIETLRSLLDL